MQLSTGTWFLLFGDQVAEPARRSGTEVPASGVEVDTAQLTAVTWAATIHRLALSGLVAMHPVQQVAGGRRRAPAGSVQLVLTRPAPPQPAYEAAVVSWLNQGVMTAESLLHQHLRRHGSSIVGAAAEEARAAGLGYLQKHQGAFSGLFRPVTIWDRPRIQAQWETFAPMLREWREFVRDHELGRSLLDDATAAYRQWVAENSG